MASRKLSDLHQPVYERAMRFLVELERQGIDVLVYCTYRSSDEQAALYAQGREDLPMVNALRKAVKLAPIAPEANRIVTRAKPGQSMHEYRCAIDLVPIESGKPIWDSNHALWKRIGMIGKWAGLEWAGDWQTFTEYPHFQYVGGLKLEDLKAGKMPV